MSRRFNPRISILLALLLALPLSGCGGAKNESAAGRIFYQNSAGSEKSKKICSKNEYSVGSRWIKGQLGAFSQKKITAAYGYASDRFHGKYSLAEFSILISTDYPMLLNIKRAEITSCRKYDQLFAFKAKIEDKNGKSYKMDYLLSLINNKWGVEAAGVTG